MRNAASKIVTREWLRAKLAEHRKRGQRIVFANGCFDTLHVGHVRYLEGARREGDILVVGVNADSSVCALKGPGRPILDETARALLVAALRAVDYVVLFSEPSVESLLEDLRPDVHAKGTDYTAETVPSAPRLRVSASESPSSATPKTTPRAISSNPFARLRMPDPRFLVLRLGSLGDIVHTFPAVAALRETFPDGEIVWLTHPRWKLLVESSGLASQVWATETRSIPSLRKIIEALRAAHWDAAIDYQGLWKSAALPFFGGIKRRIGFSSETIREFGVPILYTDRVHCTTTHIADQNGELSLTRGSAQPRRTLCLACCTKDDCGIRDYLQKSRTGSLHRS